MQPESEKLLKDFRNRERQYWLYVLKLEQDKLYVGITSKTPELRLKQHKNEFLGAAWTKLYKPLSIFDKKDLGLMTLDRAQKAENKVVRMYMNKYGYNNVRGGDISSTGRLIRRFGYYFDAEGWKDIKMMVLMIVMLLALGIPHLITLIQNTTEALGV